MHDINANIGLRIKALRLSKNISTKEIATAAKVSPHIITRIENGNSTITVPQLVLIAKKLDVLVSVVVGDLPANGKEEAGND